MNNIQFLTLGFRVLVYAFSTLWVMSEASKAFKAENLHMGESPWQTTTKI